MDTPSRPPDGPVSLTGSDPLAGLARWIASGRVGEAARARARERWLTRMAEEEATLVGVLHDLAERDRPVLVTTAASHRVRGCVRVVGADFCVIREPRVGDVIVPSATIGTIRPAPGDQPASGDRPLTVELVLAEALVELAADRPLVRVTVGGEDLRGELRSAGLDVASVALDGERNETVHLNTTAIDHLVILQR